MKKKELVGDFKNVGRECRPQGDPEEVRVHAGWVSVGIDHHTVEFPVQTIRSWWHSIKLSDAENLFRQPEQAQCTPVDLLREPAIARQTPPRPDASSGKDRFAEALVFRRAAQGAICEPGGKSIVCLLPDVNENQARDLSRSLTLAIILA